MPAAGPRGPPAAAKAPPPPAATAAYGGTGDSAAGASIEHGVKTLH